MEDLTLSPPDAAKPGYTGVDTLTITVQATDGAGNTTTVTDTQTIQFEILDNTIMGTSGNNNSLTGSSANDYISGREGNDTLTGGGRRRFS